MTEAQAAIGLDRLPWLQDEVPARKAAVPIMPLALAAAALVAATSYWLGVQTSDRESQSSAPSAALPTATVPLPQARPVKPQPAPAPQRVEPIEPVVAPPVAIVEQPAPEPVRRVKVERVTAKPVAPVVEHVAVEPKAAATPAPAKTAPAKATADKANAVPRLWPVRVIDGASGRLVRIGAFASVHQAKRGWWAIMHVNPALEHLPALVVPVRSLRDGHTYFRLQMGTTSQAHSTVLCQRMRMIAQSCVVIGLHGEGSEVAM